jgi:hypothetical protein
MRALTAAVGCLTFVLACPAAQALSGGCGVAGIYPTLDTGTLGLLCDNVSAACNPLTVLVDATYTTIGPTNWNLVLQWTDATGPHVQSWDGTDKLFHVEKAEPGIVAHEIDLVLTLNGVPYSHLYELC